MKERLLEFLKAENKSSALLAEEIGVQPSGISHILSGRNNPSLDFVMKLLERYPYLSVEWFLFGKGLMYRDQRMTELFDTNPSESPVQPVPGAEIPFDLSPSDPPGIASAASAGRETSKNVPVSGLKKIVLFYGDNSFEEYFPR